MKYTAAFFRASLPDWKKKKDSFLAKIIYRPFSFYGASVAANLGISANAISYFSAVIAVLSCLLFLFEGRLPHIAAALLMIIWNILDCVDGNLARCVHKKPFGEFADSLSSYMLVGLMSTFMGLAVYFEGGLLFDKENPWIIFIGALASSSDTMMRLIYQKYKNTERKLLDKGILKPEADFRDHNSNSNSFISIVDSEFGIGIIPVFIIFASIFGALDLVVIYCLCYYGLSFIVSTFIYIKKSIKKSKDIMM